MTVDGVPRPRSAPVGGRPEPGPAVPLARRPVAVMTIAPPWQRVPHPRRGAVRLVTRDGERVRLDPPGPTPVAPDPATLGSGPAGSPVPRSTSALDGAADADPDLPAPAPSPVSGRAPSRSTAPAPGRSAAVVYRPAVQRARPPVVEDPGILGLSRLTRGRVGSRLFTLFFVFVFALIAVQTLVELVHG